MFVPRNFAETLWPRAGKRMIFVHIPKCGGSFLSAAFGRRRKRCPTRRWKEARGHRSYLEYRNIFAGRAQDIHDHTLFTVVRNPWDWHVSWYHYVTQDVGGRRSGMALEHDQIRNLSFSDYLKWLDDTTLPRSSDDYMRHQLCDWVSDERGALVVDDMLRQETLLTDLEALRDRYHLRLSIPAGERINASERGRDYRTYYRPANADCVARRHARDIALFGYHFE